MPPILTRALPSHVPDLANLIFAAFHNLNAKHNFPDDIPNPQTAEMLATMLTTRPDFYGVVAIENQKLVGCNFAQLSDPVAGVGPICVDPATQSRGIGKELMTRITEHALKNHGPMVRLLQDAFNMTSLSLYTSLGYTVQEPVVLMTVSPAAAPDPTVRPLTMNDLDAADQLCQRVYKVSRKNELAAMIQSGPHIGCIPHARFIDNKITAALIPGFFGFAVALTEDDLLTTAQQTARTSPPPLHKILLPARLGNLYREALARKFKSIKLMSLMSLGPYTSPTNAWSPSIAY